MTTNTLPATERELRHAQTRLTDVEWRESGSGDGSFTLTGYAAVFDEETTLYDGSWWRLRERIDRGAFTDALSRIRGGGGTDPESGYPVHLLIGHNLDLPMARTGVSGVGGLDLAEDDRGLRVYARINSRVSYIADLAELMRDGVVDQMSFAFTVAEDRREVTTSDDGFEDELRTIVRIGNLYDVTVTPQGAFPQTVATLRALSRVAPAQDPAGALNRGAPADPVVTQTGAQADPVVGVTPARLAAARLRARAHAMAHKKETP